MFMMRGEVSVIVQKEDMKAQENQTVRFHHYVVSWYLCIPFMKLGKEPCENYQKL